jgi:hypothetical protein
MLDHPVSTATFLSGLGFGGKTPTLPSIFQAGDRIFDAAAIWRLSPVARKCSVSGVVCKEG